MAYQKYDQETKDMVIELWNTEKKPASQIAEELGLDKNNVGRWIREYKKSAQGKQTTSTEETKDTKTANDMMIVDRAFANQVRELKDELSKEQMKVQVLQEMLIKLMKTQIV